MNSNHTVTVEIDKLRIWCAGGWKTYPNSNNSNSTNNMLRLCFDQLFILSQDKVLESLNLHNKIKGIYKNDVLILITCNALQQVRKIKFQIKTNVANCLDKLSLHFPIVSYNNETNMQYQATYRTLEEVFKSAMNNKGATRTGPQLPTNFKDFVKICILDPCFPNVVEETEDIIKELTN